MPQQLLNGANVISVFKQMGRKRMPKGMTTNMFNDSRLQNGFSHSTCLPALSARMVYSACIKFGRTT